MGLLLAFSPVCLATHFDFVEIGTSDFNALIQKADGTTRGLSVEALKVYQDKLPNPVGVKKVNAAIVGNSSIDHLDFYYVHPSDIEKHELPAFLRGCNQVFQPHRLAVQELAKRGLPHLMRHDRVPALTFDGLAKQEGITSIGMLKLDAEGQETNIIESLVQAAKDDHRLWPTRIKYETAVHMNPAMKHHLLGLLHANKYVLIRNEEDGTIAPHANDAVHLRVTNTEALVAELVAEQQRNARCAATV